MHRSFTAAEMLWKTFLQSVSLQRFSTWNNNQGTLLISAEITDNDLYFQNCARKNIFFGTGHAASISFAPLTHTEGTWSCYMPVFSVFRLFQWLDKMPVDLALSTLKFSNIVPKDFVSPDTPTLLSCLTQGMQRHHLCQVKKTSLHLAANRLSH